MQGIDPKETFPYADCDFTVMNVKTGFVCRDLDEIGGELIYLKLQKIFLQLALLLCLILSLCSFSSL